MPFSTFVENKVVDHVNGTTSYTMPTGLVLRLFSVIPTKAYTSGAPTGTPISGSGYADQSITFGAASGGSASTNALISFPVATSNYSATVVAWAVIDGSGNCIFFHKFETTY